MPCYEFKSHQCCFFSLFRLFSEAEVVNTAVIGTINDHNRWIEVRLYPALTLAVGVECGDTKVPQARRVNIQFSNFLIDSDRLLRLNEQIKIDLSAVNCNSIAVNSISLSILKLSEFSIQISIPLLIKTADNCFWLHLHDQNTLNCVSFSFRV